MSLIPTSFLKFCFSFHFALHVEKSFKSPQTCGGVSSKRIYGFVIACTLKMLNKVVVQKNILKLDVCRENWRWSFCCSKHKQHNTLEASFSSRHQKASFSNHHQKASSYILGLVFERKMYRS